MHHLPSALFAIGIFTAIAGLSRYALERFSTVDGTKTSRYVAIIAIFFAAFWLPAYLAGGFVQDDWQLLAAASVRKIIYLHPQYSWYALDSVDGNFRPLGTILYFGFMFRWFGLAARAFTFGPFLFIWIAALVAFAITRELGYSPFIACIAALLFLSRGLLYTIVTWSCALGDGIAIVFCGLSVIFILRAMRTCGLPSVLFHLTAWLLFFIAMLGKQSAFVMPLIVALLLFLRPGTTTQPRMKQRLVTASVGLALYATTAAFVLFHAKSLSHTTSPYPIQFAPRTLYQSFAYITWYFLVAAFPDTFHAANLLPGFTGILIATGLAFLAWRHPQLLGERPRDGIFASLAAVASVSIFAMLASRSAPYYGCMAAFWFSIAFSIALTRHGPLPSATFKGRLQYFLLCVMLVSGFAEVRLEQTGLLPAGGYIWGTFGMSKERQMQESIRSQFQTAPLQSILLFADCPANTVASMTIIDAPSVHRILVYDSADHTYLVNNLKGSIPSDGFPGLNDPHSYNWTQTLSAIEASAILGRASASWMRCRNGAVERALPFETSTR